VGQLDEFHFSRPSRHARAIPTDLDVEAPARGNFLSGGFGRVSSGTGLGGVTHRITTRVVRAGIRARTAWGAWEAGRGRGTWCMQKGAEDINDLVGKEPGGCLGLGRKEATDSWKQKSK
jgi:hypothetical protein